MRYLRIFFLHFQNIFQYKSRIFVWFLVSLFHPFIYLLFWSGTPGEFSNVVLYYLYFIVAGGLLFVHVEADAYEDIQQGQLSLYLMKPMSYLKFKFFSELPWRLIQGVFGIFSLSIILILWISLPLQALDLLHFSVAFVITVFAYFILFLFKMNILVLAFWFTDIGGLQQLSDIAVIVLAGFIMPIHYFSDWMAQVAYITPFPYTVYSSVSAFLGILSDNQMAQIVTLQCFWIVLLFQLYSFLWKKGVRKFSGVGQ